MDLNLRKIPRTIYLRYILLNVPEFAAVILIFIIVRHWVVLPVWLLWCIIVLWIVKDAMLFPLIWRAYDWERAGRSRSMVGKHAIARERLAPAGYVQIHGELWRAEKIGGGPAIDIGQRVKVVKMEGLTLFVEQVIADKQSSILF